MSKLSKSGIETALGIPSVDELSAAMEIIKDGDGELYLPEDEEIEEELSIEEMKALIKDVRKERNDIRTVPDLHERQKRLESISQMSTKYFEDIMNKAFNTEDKHASDLLNAASAMLKVATDAETTLINSDTKMAELQLKKEKQDVSLNKMSANGQTKDIDGESVTIIDRNSLIKELGEDK